MARSAFASDFIFNAESASGFNFNSKYVAESPPLDTQPLELAI